MHMEVIVGRTASWGVQLPVNLPPGGGRIAGVRVTEGSVQRSAPLVRVIRDGQLIYEVGFGVLAALPSGIESNVLSGQGHYNFGGDVS
eukprot:scaffold93039_cov17-Tisochrysis_lutea.AAC.1